MGAPNQLASVPWDGAAPRLGRNSPAGSNRRKTRANRRVCSFRGMWMLENNKRLTNCARGTRSALSQHCRQEAPLHHPPPLMPPIMCKNTRCPPWPLHDRRIKGGGNQVGATRGAGLCGGDNLQARMKRNFCLRPTSNGSTLGHRIPQENPLGRQAADDPVREGLPPGGGWDGGRSMLTGLVRPASHSKSAPSIC